MPGEAETSVGQTAGRSEVQRSKTDTGLLGEPARSYYQERRLMRREFATSLMSSTKWRKLFRAVEQLELDVWLC